MPPSLLSRLFHAPDGGRTTVGVLAAALLVAAAAGHLGSPGPAAANGGTLRLSNVAMGSYLVSAFTDPTPVRPDSLDVSVLVVLARSGELAEEVEVTVRSRHLEGAAPEEVRPATREQADDPRYLAAKFALGAEGPWALTVEVRGPGGSGEATFEVRARERGLLGHPLVLVVLALLPLALVGAWVTRQGDDG
jgi:hypothetical protein